VSVKHTTDFAPLIETVASARLERIAEETVHLLRRNVPPFFIAGHAGVPAAWGDTEGHPLSTLAAGGQIADWTRSIPASSETESEEQRRLAAALPLTAALAVAAPAIQAGERSQPDLPSPLFPANITHADGMSGALREAVRSGQITRTEQLLLGYYGTGTDYRSYLTNIYRSIIEHYTGDGHTLIFVHRSSQVLDMAGWGNKLPPFIHWLAPLLSNKQPDAPFLAEVAAFLSDPAHDLKPLRTRLAPANTAAAGAELRQAILQGSLGDTCTAVSTALMSGAPARAVGSVIVLAAARRFLAAPEGDAEALSRAGHVLLVASAARTAVSQIQDVELLPLLFIAAAAVNGLREVEQVEAPRAASASGRMTLSGSVAGGILAPVMLRSLERQLESGDEQAAQATARRYLQLGHPARSLVAMLALVACQGDATSDAGHTLLLAQAAAEEYLALPAHLQGSEGEALLAVGVHAASRRPQGTSILEAVRQALA
jgi:hypothetical protein